MKTRTKLLFPFAAAPMVVLVALQACGGDTNNGSDASADGTTSDVTPDVVAQDTSTNDVVQTNDSSCPTYTGSVEFCKAAVAKCNACPGSTKFTTCDLQNLDAVCNAAENVFSLAFSNAANACASVCDSDASNACEKAAVADASLTNAQQKLVTDYCAHCGLNAGCAAQAAAEIVEYADPVVTTIDQKCAPDAGGPDSSTCSQFGGCAGTTLLAALGSLPCADAGSD